ncbi:S-layer homology domain-containing protein [Ammoniphilus sp. CFH 90114]|uniref:S-layer homology domain-containing protein n=1 Tax=Ammoniphilus sp. CFH 90114 TaxID=2493665 RepID=UPI00100F8766|nr:S-layer homology domain-containing protein [Ammoniphilus sp. CFH 90114]RXT02860.1 hypothetical protein EIZ39_24015 [Ammoniphilus sp. CFH 90114]
MVQSRQCAAVQKKRGMMMAKRKNNRTLRTFTKPLLLFLVLMLLVQPIMGIPSTQAQSPLELKIGSKEVLRGERISLPVYLTSDGQVQAIQFDLTFNDDLLTLVRVREGDIKGLSVMANESKRKVMIAGKGSLPQGTEKIIAYLDFDVRTTSTAVNTTVRMDNPVIGDVHAGNIVSSTTFQSGSVTVKALEGPIFVGVKEGMTYGEGEMVKPNVVKPANVKTVTLFRNGQQVLNYALGTELNEAGNYLLLVTNQNGVEASVRFTIDRSVKLAGIVLDLYQYRLEEGQSQQVVVRAKYSNGSTATVSTGITYKIANASLARVSTDGFITGLKKGTTFLTVTYGGMTVNANVEILAKTLSAEAELLDIALSSGTLSPAFSSSKANYKISVQNIVNKITIRPTVKHPNSTLKVNGTTIASGSTVAVDLPEGITIIQIEVTAENGIKKSLYTLEVKRVTKQFDETAILYPQNGSTIIYEAPRITGRSEPGSKVEVYVDQRSVGTAWTGPDGRWSLVSNRLLSSGIHEAYAVTVDNFGNSKVSNPPVKFTVDTTTRLVLEAFPSEVEGDGKSQFTIRATLKTDAGAPIRDVRIRFELDAGSVREAEEVTGADGVASITLTAPKLEGVLPMKSLIRARVRDLDGNFLQENSIIVHYLPASVKGVVIDHTTGKAVKGATVELKEDFNGDGIPDFVTSVTTGEDGSYKIYVPQGNWKYTPIIKFNKEVAPGQTFPVEVKQTANVGDLNEIGPDKMVPANKNVSGLLLMTDKKDGQVKEIQKVLSDGEQIETKVTDASGQEVPGLTLDEDGRFQLEDVPPGEYKILFQVVAPTGEKLAAKAINVSVGDEQVDGELGIQVELVDPYGIVSDRVTGKPIVGVKMSLYWSDTDLNRKSGRVPHTLVPLPVLDDFPPNQNRVPQWTTEEGEYAWMVFPDGDYYLVGEKEGYITFDSREDTRNEQQGPTSYIRDGIIHVGDSIVEYDLTMQPIASPGGDSGSDSSSGGSTPPVVEKLPVITPVKKPAPYIFGYPGEIFMPQKSLTRAEMAAILTKVSLGEKELPKRQVFPDVGLDFWASGSIAFVEEHQLMIGYPDGSFQPQKEVTRAEMATIALKLKKLQEGDQSTNFPDAAKHWANKVISTAYEAEYMIGYTDGLFRPNRSITRAEAVTVFNKLLGRRLSKKPEQSSYKDVGQQHWAYEQIEAASTSEVVQEFLP